MSVLCPVIVALCAALAISAPMDAAAESVPVALKGTLIKYAGGPMNTAFISGTNDRHRGAGRARASYSHKHTRHLILVGGLTDAFLFAPYSDLLDRQISERGWTLVHTQLSSSGAGWGAGSLDEDAEELNLLARYLKQHHSSAGIILMGHSTGCQDVVRYVQRYGGDRSAARLLGVVVQAPVSDREALYMGDSKRAEEQLAEAAEWLENGQGEDILYRDSGAGHTPVTARRFHALAARLGDDDMFSSDLTPKELKEILAPLASVPSLFIMSEKDGSVPPQVDLPALARRFEAASGPLAKAIIVPGAGHGMHGHEEECVDAVVALIDRLPRLSESSG